MRRNPTFRMRNQARLSERTNEALSSLAKNSLYFSKSNTIRQSNTKKTWSKSPPDKEICDNFHMRADQAMSEVESISELVTEQSDEEEYDKDDGSNQIEEDQSASRIPVLYLADQRESDQKPNEINQMRASLGMQTTKETYWTASR